jgi:hypothetical protein
MPIYHYGALLCYLAIRSRYNNWWYISGIAVYAIYAVYLMFDKAGVLSWVKEHDAENIVQTMKATKHCIE